jgi:hypothetical protein
MLLFATLIAVSFLSSSHLLLQCCSAWNTITLEALRFQQSCSCSHGSCNANLLEYGDVGSNPEEYNALVNWCLKLQGLCEHCPVHQLSPHAKE